MQEKVLNDNYHDQDPLSSQFLLRMLLNMPAHCIDTVYRLDCKHDANKELICDLRQCMKSNGFK